LSSILGIVQVDLHSLEEEYRRSCAWEDYSLFVLASLLIDFPIVALAGHDFQFLGLTSAAYALQAWRFAFLVWNFVLLIWLRRNEDSARFDKHVFAWILSGVALGTVVRFTRPANYLDNFAIDVVMVMILFLMLGIRRPLRTIPPVLYAVGALATLLFWKELPDSVGLGTILVSLVLATVGGYVLAYRGENNRRREFAYRRREQETKRQLEETILDLRRSQAEAKNLEGLLPICAQCKKIRDDAGDWHILEAYIVEHSEAQFTHGLCPECLKAYFPEDDRTVGRRA